ncbi:outer membrane protein assembly factor BamB [Brumicola nitratireducens]|uniref:Outer membrane protein assembly factor BamB n=1 Tax=Glaciecola nitratireducens (strain JCM 12485 / KCTC 12276 / FR1064) TaxID=1085623 RepID=G4QK42_GLANF|nr:outer membrane protein assembly factor BamB [Glaciecola nitratireducens]AEP29164.1 outer membrane protein assembly complex subunit YfgL [Glaciecola nitratireducens FR1064]
MKNRLIITLLALSLSGCATVSDWFADDEELEIRRLKPIEAAFEPEIKWDIDVGDGVQDYFSRLAPAVAYGKVFAASRDGIVVAIDQETGKKIWEQDFANYENYSFKKAMLWYSNRAVSAKISGGLSVAYQSVYFGTEDGYVYALEESTGELKWKVGVKGEVISAPAVDAGVVLVNTTSGHLIALNPENGEQKWVTESDVPPLTLRGVSAPAADSGGALIGTPSGKLKVSILETGMVAWETQIASPSGATELERIVDIDVKPLVFGGNVFVVSYNGTLSAVELRTGQVIWTREYGSYRNISIDGNRLFVVDNSSNIFAIDRRSGVELWSNVGLKDRNITSATPHGDYVVVGDMFGFIHWFTKDEGKLVAQLAVGDDDEDEAIFTGPISAENILYVQTRDGKIAAVIQPQ